MKYIQSFDAVNEAKRSAVHKAAKKGSYPAVIVVVQDGKVIHQEPVSTPGVAPATFNVMQEKYPKALLHLEDNTGKRLFSESVVTEVAKIETERYVRSHGKKPKGYGGWMFSYNRDGSDEWQIPNGMSWPDAQKWAKKKAKEDGEDYVYVMENESVTESEDTVGGLNKMANTDLERIADYADMIKDRMSQGQTLDAWMYSKISDSVKNLNSVHDTMDGNDGVNEARDADLIKQLTDTFGKFKLNRKYEIMMDSLFGGGEKIPVLRKRNTYGDGAMIDVFSSGNVHLRGARSARPIPGKNIFNDIDSAMAAATKYVDSIKESVTESKAPDADKAIKDLEKQGSQIDWLDDADNATKNIWKKAGVNPDDENTIILYSYANGSWPETKKILNKHKVDFKELEDPNADGESFIVFVKESVINEATDLNDPVLVAFRRTRAIMELPKFKSAEVKSRRISFNKYMDLLDSQSDITTDIANYVDIMAQTLRDMEQEAEPEGGVMADKYGSIMMKQEKEYTQLKAKKAKIDARIEKYKMS